MLFLVKLLHFRHFKTVGQYPLSVVTVVHPYTVHAAILDNSRERKVMGGGGGECREVLHCKISSLLWKELW